MNATYVIVGASLAGAKAAETLRQEGFGGPLMLIGDETQLPYERPPLSKDYLLGEEFLERGIKPGDLCGQLLVAAGMLAIAALAPSPGQAGSPGRNRAGDPPASGMAARPAAGAPARVR